MKDPKNHIDDLFRRSFEGYSVEPSASVWNNIVHKYFNTGFSTSGLLSIQNIVSIILIVGTSVLIQYGFYPLEQDNDSTNTPILENHSVSNSISTVQATEKFKISTLANQIKQVTEPNNISNESIDSETPIFTSQVDKPHISPESISQNPQAPPSDNKLIIEKVEIPNISSEQTVPGQLNKTETLASLMETPITLKANKYTSYVSTTPLSGEKRTDLHPLRKPSTPQTSENLMGAQYTNPFKISKREKDYFRKAHISYRNKYSQVPIQWNNDYLFRSPWAVGLLFGYEWIYYPGDSIEKKNAYSIDLTAIYQNDQFLFRSGIGISVSNDNGEFIIDYETYDSTGFYYGVNSFYINSDNPDNPVFDTYAETVYDSVEHTSYEHPENQYTYIQIPLLIGYKVLNINRFSCSLMGGPVLSILVHEDEKTFNSSDNYTTLINIEDNTPQRLKTNWQFMFSAGLNYRISNHLDLSIEPTYKYYIQSVYEQRIAGTKNPWSIGFRGGIVYTF